MIHTKIVCTIGPSTSSPAALRELIQKGMDVARLNFSHGTQVEHKEKIRLIRQESEKQNKSVAVLQDLAGPKIRVGAIPEPGIFLEAGQTLVLTSSRRCSKKNVVSVNFPGLVSVVKKDDPILLADGTIELKVTNIKADEIVCQVITGDLLSSHKGVNLPSRSLNIPPLTQKDKKDLLFGIEQDVDYIALSFVRTKYDIQAAKKILKKHGKNIPIIAKIEKHEALDNTDEIIEVSDAIMVARGDLGVEIPLERVPIVQKDLIRKANERGKPVITATQMLRTMVESPRPTRAEATDVANAVLDGTDAVMLSEETAVGRYPVKAVEFMRRIIQNAEEFFPHGKYLQWIPSPHRSETVAHASCVIAAHLKAAAIIAQTTTGQTAGQISRFRPRQPIIALSPRRETIRRLALVWGCVPFLVSEFKGADQMIENTARSALKTGLAAKGDMVVITSGHPVGIPGSTNMVRVKQL
ncbi:MAG: pyruvate kinase [Candidatus Aminicenantes bacterium]|nr:pyruvate kinase [Candidatus Aminicenantes bacterium]